MTPQELKNSVLQRAIRGKLVEQRPEEGTGEELYQAIQAEKRRLIQSGQLKKEKPLPEITDNEIPFDIPDTWKWVRLGFCSSYANSKEKIAAGDIASDTWTLDLEDIEKETGKIIRFANVQDRKIVGDKVRFAKGQILYSKLRPYLKKILVAPKDGVCTSELVPFSAYGDIDPNYIAYFLKSPFADYFINSSTYGMKMPRVGTETMTNLVVPLPPLAEQRRIVAKIEELTPYIDRYAAAWNRLEAFNTRFPSDMRKSLLQMAIQGKLVEQRPEEGTGEELYRTIQAEKQRLIKSGKLKKEKPLPEITEDEIPFDIPDSWKWVRLANLFASIADGDHQPPPQTANGVPFIVISNVSNGALDFTNTRFVSPSYFQTLSSERIAEKGDILFTVTGSYGIPVMVDTDTSFCFQRHIALLKTISVTCEEYLLCILNSPLISQQCDAVATGTAQKTVGTKALRNFVVPLPPLAEQRRIVARLKELLPLCDGLQ